MQDQEKQIAALNELLKGEHMALQIYENSKDSQGDPQVAKMLNDFAEDHKKHAQQLAQRIQELGGKPQSNMGFPGMMANVSTTINSWRGPQALLQQVYDGEDKGVHAYEDRIDELDSVSQAMVRDIMSEDHEHLKQFKARMEEEKSERANQE